MFKLLLNIGINLIIYTVMLAIFIFSGDRIDKIIYIAVEAKVMTILFVPEIEEKKRTKKGVFGD
ncbi:MAG: hypothetical protein QNJ38_11180 [Prochloraceae cyanobacterium]|nr:hypothetical protein [Prochloraceae cyanobacterium]